MTDEKNKLTLLELKSKTKAYVEDICAGENLKRRLIAMGVYKGCSIEKKSGFSQCPVIVKVCGTTVALGKAMAGKIIVKTDD